MAKRKYWYVCALLVSTALCVSIELVRAQPQPSVEARAVSGHASPEPAEIEASLAAQRARKLAVDSELAVLPEVQKSLEETLFSNVRALYRLKRGGLLPLSGGLEAFMSHASRVAHLERLARRTLGELDKTRVGREKLAKEVRALDLEIAEGEQRVAALASARTIASAFEAAEVAVVPKTSPSAPAAQGRLDYGLSLVDQGEPHARRAFSDDKGGLALPVAAPSSVQSAEHGQGITFLTRSGASVRAAADGRVVFADRDPSQGLRVVVDHGQRYHTSYAGLRGVDVQLGDALSKSARLGTAGSDPIVFEVRRGTRSLDARAWLGL